MKNLSSLDWISSWLISLRQMKVGLVGDVSMWKASFRPKFPFTFLHLLSSEPLKSDDCDVEFEATLVKLKSPLIIQSPLSRVSPNVPKGWLYLGN